MSDQMATSERPARVGAEPSGGALSRAERSSVAACRGIVKRRARNFYYGLRLLPEPKRSAVYTVYAWMRAADDIADGGGTVAARREELARLRSMTERAFGAAGGGGTVAAGESWVGWAGFVWTVRRFGLVLKEFEAVLDALEMDLAADDAAEGMAHEGDGPRVLFSTMEELEEYCAGVASAVGVICVRIWGWREWVSWDRVSDLARRRGQAFQLTNVLRDVRDDFDEGRVYMPSDVLETHGVRASEVAKWSSPAASRALVEELAAEAAAHYDASAELDRLIDPRCVATLWAMTKIYRGVLDRIEADPSLVSRPGGAARLSGGRKVVIAGRAIARSVVGVR